MSRLADEGGATRHGVQASCNWAIRYLLIIRSAGVCLDHKMSLFGGKVPWQGDDEKSTTTVTCGGKAVPIAMNGRHTTLVDIRDGETTLH